MHQIFLVLFTILKELGILFEFILPHLVNNDLVLIIFLVLLDHLVDLGLSLSILFVRVVLTAFGEGFVG